jgi:hypothetical protein
LEGREHQKFMGRPAEKVKKSVAEIGKKNNGSLIKTGKTNKIKIFPKNIHSK